MILLRAREHAGRVGGYALGMVTGTISWLRQSRMFHPTGLIFVGSATSLSSDLPLPGHVLLRFSSAWWKDREWIDVLGVALRFSNSSDFTEQAKSTDQDLLFATIQHPWTLPFAPFTTHFHDFLSNDYFAVCPFSTGPGTHAKQAVKFKLTPASSVPSRKNAPGENNRDSKLREAVELKTAVFTLQWMDNKKAAAGWSDIARIEIEKPVDERTFDGEKLRFSPFRCGCGIHPRGLIHYLRIGAYSLSQWARPASQSTH